MKKETYYHAMLDKLYSGLTNEEENRELNSISSKQLEKNIEQYSQQKWEESGDEIDPDLASRMRDSLLCRISSTDTNKSRERKRIFTTLGKVAAAIVIFTASIFGGIKYSENKLPLHSFDVIAERGQKSSITLPDGSRVWLNSGTKISYSSQFNIKDRNITLDGEAYFEVTRNAKLPFTVNANEMLVTALGTKFNVKAYTDEDEIIATLVEGKIKTSAGEREEIITPNNQSRYDRSSGKMYVKKVAYSDHVIPWRNNELIFESETLGEISRLLERMYNVEIIFSDESVMEYKYNGLVRNNSLHNVLSLISSTSPVKYQIFGNTIKFSKNI